MNYTTYFIPQVLYHMLEYRYYNESSDVRCECIQNATIEDLSTADNDRKYGVVVCHAKTI